MASTNDPVRTASVLAVLGDTALALGDFSLAEERLERALATARSAEKPGLVAAVLNSRGNLRLAQGRPRDAVVDYDASARAASQAGDPTLAASASANALRAAIEAGPDEDVLQRAATLQEQATSLSGSSTKARLFLSLGRSYELISKRSDAARAYNLGRQEAERVGDTRTLSYALGYMGGIYEQQGRRAEAIELTRRALFSAQQVGAPEAIYLWQWQLGRIQAEEQDIEAAVVAYRAAVTTLDGLRAEGALPTTGAARDFEASVKPVYFGLVDLLLQKAASSEDTESRETLLLEARDTVESLKTAELRDYFEDECLAAQSQAAPESIPNTVVVYPVLLPDRTELIVSLPAGMRSFIVPVSRKELETKVTLLRGLLQKRTTREYRPHAAALYDWLIRPVERATDFASIETLVFVPDGALRTIPIAALYDSEAKVFLIQKVPIAVIPGLTLTDPRRIERGQVKMLTVGLTESVQGFPPLPHVEGEIAAIQTVFEGGRSLVNQKFVAAAVERELSERQFSIVHIASHGEFTANSRESYLLTYDGKIPMDDLSGLVSLTQYREEPIELLSLSACETAAGDERAALGLAGVAVRAGARSALATLWTVNDQGSAELVGEFYRQLENPEVSRAGALQHAQISLIEQRPYRHPGYWSPFLLINNWL